jgi:hypothetical protein
MKNTKNISNELATKKAIEMTILDAIEKGHLGKNKLMEYMKSKTFETSVVGYKKLLKTI